MQYVLIEGQPFRGNAQSVIAPDGTVAWSGGLTPAQYEAERGIKIKIVDEEDYLKLENDYVSSLVTEPERITEEKWQYALDVLPPCRWKTYRGIEFFHIVERVTHDLVAWYAHVGDHYFWFNDLSDVSYEHLADKIASVLK